MDWFSCLLNAVTGDVCEGIIESDDVACLSHEIEKAMNFCKKCNILVESVKRKESLVLCTSFYIFLFLVICARLN